MAPPHCVTSIFCCCVSGHSMLHLVFSARGRRSPSALRTPYGSLYVKAWCLGNLFVGLDGGRGDGGSTSYISLSQVESEWRALCRSRLTVVGCAKWREGLADFRRFIGVVAGRASNVAGVAGALAAEFGRSEGNNPE